MSSRRGVTSRLATQVPLAYANADEWHKDLRRRKLVGQIDTESDVWEDIRPGTAGKRTVEVRTCDVTPSVDTGAAIAAVIQAYEFGIRQDVLQVGGTGTGTELIWLDRGTRAAAQFGLDAHVMELDGQPRILRDSALQLAELLLPIADALGTEHWIGVFQDIVRNGNAADRILHEAGIDRDHDPQGQSDEAGLRRATRWIIDETARPPSCAWPPVELNHLTTAA